MFGLDAGADPDHRSRGRVIAGYSPGPDHGVVAGDPDRVAFDGVDGCTAVRTLDDVGATV